MSIKAELVQHLEELARTPDRHEVEQEQHEVEEWMQDEAEQWMQALYEDWERRYLAKQEKVVERAGKRRKPARELMEFSKGAHSPIRLRWVVREMYKHYEELDEQHQELQEQAKAFRTLLNQRHSALKDEHDLWRELEGLCQSMEERQGGKEEVP